MIYSKNLLALLLVFGFSSQVYAARCGVAPVGGNKVGGASGLWPSDRALSFDEKNRALYSFGDSSLIVEQVGSSVLVHAYWRSQLKTYSQSLKNEAPIDIGFEDAKSVLTITLTCSE